MRNESDFNLNQLSVNLQESLEQELNIQETITWMDQPNPLSNLGHSLIMAFSGLTDMGLAIGLYFMIELPIFIGIPIFLFGLGFLSAPLWVIKKRKQTFYILTDKRALILQGGILKKIDSFMPDQLKNISREQNQDGSGSLVFERSVPNANMNQHSNRGFFSISNVKEVHEKIDKLIES